MPKWIAGLPLPGMGGALALSALAHAVALTGWLYWRHHSGPQTSVGQQRGGLTVLIKALPSHTRQARSPQSSPPPEAPAHSAPPPSPRPAAKPLPQSAPEAEPPAAQATASQAQAITEPVTQAASQAGATFANMFAPVIARPIGRGRWASANPAMLSPVDQDALRQQAMDSVRRQLFDRVDLLARQLPSQPLSGTCGVQISLETQTGQLTCEQEADMPRIWQGLAGVVRSAPPGQANANFCLRIEPHKVEMKACDTAPQFTAPPHQ